MQRIKGIFNGKQKILRKQSFIEIKIIKKKNNKKTCENLN